eukprot:3554456-Amphidinium_carterae.1
METIARGTGLCPCAVGVGKFTIARIEDMASHTVCVQLFHVACVDADAQPAHIIGIRDAGEQRPCLLPCLPFTKCPAR